eukprot:TRINITY_DN732_c0_g1_i1.p1 TRINITY_DN732_c0_g1~~TRINITY_DN732_c0_g1_i1.p1  ORF type:complete len:494 (-),score=78.36 TRINITY_DN732_c0_g1_i1:166-1596(-)
MFNPDYGVPPAGGAPGMMGPPGGPMMGPPGGPMMGPPGGPMMGPPGGPMMGPPGGPMMGPPGAPMMGPPGAPGPCGGFPPGGHPNKEAIIAGILAQEEKQRRVEDLYLHKLKKDTYEERRKDGRVSRTPAVNAATFLSIASALLQFGAIAAPAWRSDYYGSFFYAHSRNFGLFAISGWKFQFLHDMSYKTCLHHGELKLFNGCQSPICKWYGMKCRVYTDMMYTNYSTTFLLTFALIAHIVCAVFVVRMTPRMFRWASCWMKVVAVFYIGGLLLIYFMSEMFFAQLGLLSFYPYPPTGLSFYASCMSLFMVIVVNFLLIHLVQMWPEYADTSDEDSSSSDSDASNDGRKKKRRGSSDSSDMDYASHLNAMDKGKGKDFGKGYDMAFDKGKGKDMFFDKGKGDMGFDKGKGYDMAFDKGKGDMGFDKGKGKDMGFDKGKGDMFFDDKGKGKDMGFDKGKGEMPCDDKGKGCSKPPGF